ncbi:MAG TPA: hypothetical protein VFZ25_16175 [Chloroflexota bacterium]|nr:hypothetical protein [Chloroflexota bacterium]
MALVATAAFGWLLGIPSARLVRALGAGSAVTVPSRWALLAPDPALQGLQSALFAVLAWHFGPTPGGLVYAALSVVLTLVLFIDLRTRFVYGFVAYPGIVAGILLTPLVAGGPWWGGLASALIGGAIFGALYLLGRLLYRGGEPLATGDITIGALVGSVVGLGHLGPAIVYGVLLSGFFALFYAARTRSLSSFLPYGPGLCLGALLALVR